MRRDNIRSKVHGECMILIHDTTARTIYRRIQPDAYLRNLCGLRRTIRPA